MQEVVHSNLHSKLFGKGLPEQMRSTAFAFLGLTAAGALTLVAIFAQLSFPLLSPVPLPAGPGGESRIGDGVSLAGEHVAPLRRAVAAPAPGPVARGSRESSGTREAAPAPAPAGGTHVSHPAGGGVTPAPGPAAPPKPAPPGSAPAVDPPHQTPPAAAPEPAPTPKLTPAVDPTPAPPPPAPAPPPPVARPPALPATAAASPPAHSNAGGSGMGNAYGRSK